MPSATLVALLDATSDGPRWARGWVEDILLGHLPGYADRSSGRAPVSLRGWTIGAVLGNEPLVQSRPIVRVKDADPLDDLLRTPASCIVASFAMQDSAAPRLTAKPTVQISRFRRWIGARAEPELPASRAKSLREALPEFLARGQVHRSDGELVFLTFLAELHRAGGLGNTYATSEQIHRALGALDDRLADVSPHNLMLNDGRTFAMLHREGTLLAFDAPPDAPRARGYSKGDPSGSPGKLLLHLPGPAPTAPIAGAERIAEGRFTIDTRRPWIMHRS